MVLLSPRELLLTDLSLHLGLYKVSIASIGINKLGLIHFSSHVQNSKCVLDHIFWLIFIFANGNITDLNKHRDSIRLLVSTKLAPFDAYL